MVLVLLLSGALSTARPLPSDWPTACRPNAFSPAPRCLPRPPPEPAPCAGSGCEEPPGLPPRPEPFPPPPPRPPDGPRDTRLLGCFERSLARAETLIVSRRCYRGDFTFTHRLELSAGGRPSPLTASGEGGSAARVGRWALEPDGTLRVQLPGGEPLDAALELGEDRMVLDGKAWRRVPGA
jgi:hypothetical protein